MKPNILMLWILGFTAVQAVADEAATTDLAYKTRFVGEAHGLRADTVFAPGVPLTSFGRDRARFEQEARGRVGPVSLLLTGTFSGQEGQHAAGKLLANEAYVDFGSGENRFSAGKKILSGDVGYGFRPIDVLQREVRLQALPPTLEGIPSLIWERFTADKAWSMVWANPGYGRRGDPRDDGSLALRGYRRWQGADLHGVARLSSRYGSELGAAISTVPHESLELHASFLAQRRGERFAPLAAPATIAQLLAPDQALRTVTIDAPRKLLGGLHVDDRARLVFAWRSVVGRHRPDRRRLEHPRAAGCAAQRAARLPGRAGCRRERFDRRVDRLVRGTRSHAARATRARCVDRSRSERLVGIVRSAAHAGRRRMGGDARRGLGSRPAAARCRRAVFRREVRIVLPADARAARAVRRRELRVLTVFFASMTHF